MSRSFISKINKRINSLNDQPYKLGQINHSNSISECLEKLIQNISLESFSLFSLHFLNMCDHRILRHFSLYSVVATVPGTSEC